MCDCNTNLCYSDEPTGRLALVFELMEMNLYEAIKAKINKLKITHIIT